uniref:Uncharacterized protein n=1 Tax=Panagrolaimus davidi TaxID=227884 RepID=A0A914PPM6_9BILA
MFEYSQDDLETNLIKLMKVIDEKGSQFLTFENAWISDEEQNNIMDILHTVQQHLDKISKFIEETDGWIFKIPEIQQAFDEKNKKSESKSEECYDIGMDCESQCDDSDENDMNDDEESGDAELESSENDEMKDSFVFV